MFLPPGAFPYLPHGSRVGPMSCQGVRRAGQRGQPGGLTPRGWTLLPCTPPIISLVPESPPALPRPLPALAISLLLTFPPDQLFHFFPCPIATSPHLWALSTPCCWCPTAWHSMGWCMGQVAAHSLTPQLCLCPPLTPRSPSRRYFPLGPLWKDQPLRPALVLSACPARRARSRQRRAPRMMQMMTGTETLPLPLRRPRGESVWARIWNGQHQAWVRWEKNHS